MSERSVTIWNLVVGFTVVSIIAMSFKLFPMNKKFNRLKDRSADLQFGTDKELENIISYLEGRLEERSDFQFTIDNNIVYTFSPDNKNDSVWPFDKPFYLILNLAIGGHFGGFEVDNNVFPQEFIIDYIKVYNDTKD